MTAKKPYQKLMRFVNFPSKIISNRKRKLIFIVNLKLKIKIVFFQMNLKRRNEFNFILTSINIYENYQNDSRYRRVKHLSKLKK